MEALALVAGPLALRTTPAIRAQKDLRLPSSFFVFGLGAGGFRLLPVSRLYLALPLAVRPAPLDTGNFSPRPTARLTPFLGKLRSFFKLRQAQAARVLEVWELFKTHPVTRPLQASSLA